MFSHGILRNLVEFELEHYVRKLFPVCQFPIEGKNANSYSIDRSALTKAKEKSLKCSNTNICEKSSFNHVSASNVVSREAVESSSVKRGKQKIANAKINNIADCNKKVDKVEIQLQEKSTEDSEVSSELEGYSWYTNIPLLKGKEVSPSHEFEICNKSDNNIRIDIAFSKDVNIGDVEALSMVDLATSCVFVKYEMENLQEMMSKLTIPSNHYKDFLNSDVSQSTTSNPKSDKGLKVNSKILNIKHLDPSYPLNKTFNLERFKQVALNEDVKTESNEIYKTASHRILIGLLKVTKKANEYDNKLNFGLVNVDQVKRSLESITVFEEACDRIYADILLLLGEDSLDVSFEREDSVLGTADLFSFPRTDIEEGRMSYTDVTEEFQVRTDHIKYHKESLLDHCCVGTLDVFTEIEDEELEYIIEQTKQLEVMLKKFARNHDACEVNTSTEYPPNITVPEMHSITKDNTPLVKVQDKSYGWDSSEQSVEGQKSPWKECKIVNGEGRVSWKRAMQIWGVGTNYIFYPDL